MKNILHKTMIVCFILILGIIIFCPAEKPASAQAGADANALATMNISSDLITWQPLVDYKSLTLTVVAPSGALLTRSFDSGNSPILSVDELPGDGLYGYELRLTPKIDANIQSSLQAVADDPERRAKLLEELSNAGVIPSVASQSGTFTVLGGQFVTPVEEEVSVSSPSGTSDGGNSINDILHYDDVIVTGSLCTGFDCVDGESFSYDTLKLKENNLQIYFDDTSTSAGFPANDWRLIANDSKSGGASYLKIEDSTNGKTPFKIMAGARTDGFFMSSSGRIGLGTSTPVLELHIQDSDTPSIRLEQDGSGLWTPQTWDLAGNEASFFLRDATNGSKLPFRIQPNTPSNTLSLKSSGYVGIGTWSPAYSFEVERTGENANIVAERTDGATAVLSAITNTVQIGSLNNFPIEILINDTPVITVTGEGDLTLQGTTGGATAEVSANANTVQIGSRSNHAVEMVVNDSVVMTVTAAGNMTLQGALSEYSDVNVKENFAAVDGYEVLDRLNNIPITTWNYIHDDAETQHMGPMAQDFYTAFELGADDRHIASLDVNGVSLAAIQTLSKITSDQKTQIDKLSAENTELKGQVNDLESRLSKLEQAAGNGNGSSGLSLWSLVIAILVIGVMQVAPMISRKMKHG